MKSIQSFLIFLIVVIYAVTAFAVQQTGINWPVVFFGDLLNLDWRAQFNTDFLLHLFLLAIWISWREGFTLKGHLFGFLSVSWGGMFGFPYFVYAIYKAKFQPKEFLLGVHSDK